MSKQERQKIHKEIKTVLEKMHLLFTVKSKSKQLKIYLLKHLPQNIYLNDEPMAKEDHIIWIAEGGNKHLLSSKLTMNKFECLYIDEASVDCRVEEEIFQEQKYEDSPKLSSSSSMMDYLINVQLDDKGEWYIHGFRMYTCGFVPWGTSKEFEKEDLEKHISPLGIHEYYIKDKNMTSATYLPKIKK